MRKALILLLLGLPSFQALHLTDLGGYHSDLAGLHRRSDDAATKAEDAEEAEKKLRDFRDDDTTRDGYQSESSAFNSTKDDLESALGDVASKVSSASLFI